jgi:phenylalanyl-tRNA synthetase beta chain
MKFSENWLRDLVTLDAPRDLLVERLTMAGLEVEGVEVIGDGLDGVVIAEIVAAEPHPNADRLRVCTVSTGAPSDHTTIVCGAPNARIGLRAPLALPGTVLPAGMTIRVAAVRGVESAGMLCSAAELGLAAEAAGLLELPADAPVGAPLAQWLGLPDASLELKLTPNRPDCLGMEGLAAEVATLFDVPCRASNQTAVTPNGARVVPIRIEAPEACPRYLGRVIENVDPTRPTPVWMVERLRRAGVRAISAIVDCTNYVMLELGQPMHAFDLDCIDGEIIVRRAGAQERVILLDEREVALDSDFLVIADARSPLAVAGVMGGHASRVSDATRHLFLESAFFAPAAIIGRARKLGLHTDASHRFERGVDPELPERALERLTALLIEVVGGSAGPIIRAEYSEFLPQQPAIPLRRERLARILGMAIPDERVAGILRGLDMRVDTTSEGWTVVPPSRRFDLAIEEDLIEEVARVQGYDSVPIRLPSVGARVAAPTEARVADAVFRGVLTTRGYVEAINFSFVPPGWLEAWQLDDAAVALANPLSADLAVMRTSLLPGLVDAIRRNLARQQARVRLFETGRTFRSGPEGPVETQRLALAAYGNAAPEQWGNRSRPMDWYDLRGDVEHLLALLGAGRADITLEPASDPWLHPGRSAEVKRGGVPIGSIGILHPRLCAKLDFDRDVHVAEFDLDALVDRQLPSATAVSPYPQVRRDLALVIDQSIPFASLAALVRRVAGPTLVDLVLFDEYRGPGLTADRRSLAIGLILQDESRTLTDLDVDTVVAAVVDAAGEEFGATLRA